MSPGMGSITLSFDRGTLVLTGLSQQEIRGLLLRQDWTWDPRVSAWRTHAMEYPVVRRALLAAPQSSFVDRLPPPPRVAWPKSDLPPLRKEQRDAISAWESAGHRGVIVMPTGTGKTEVALAAMAQARVATLIVAPVRDLMHQWHQRILRRLGYDAGIVGDSIFNIQPVTVTTYDSAYARMPEMGQRFGLIIFDEAHHLPGRSYRESAMFCTAPMRMGLTATPERADGRQVDLDWLIGPAVYRQEISSAKGRTLADYDVVRIPVKLEDREQQLYDEASRVVRGFIIQRNTELRDASPGVKISYTWQDLCGESGHDPAARRAQRAFWFKRSIEDRAAEKIRVLEDLFRLHVGQRIIVFAGSNAMAIDVSRRFLVPTLLSHSRKKERREVLEGLASGRFPVLVANQVLDEGVDVPEAKLAVVIGGQASTRQAKQRLGRILRRTGDARATLYEIVCQDTNEEERSRARRRSDAYEGVKRRVAK